MKTSRIAKAAVVAATMSLTAPLVLAQNVAVVNGKGVPKARVDAMVEQILKQTKGQGQAQEKTPDLVQKVKDNQMPLHRKVLAILTVICLTLLPGSFLLLTLMVIYSTIKKKLLKRKLKKSLQLVKHEEKPKKQN